MEPSQGLAEREKRLTDKVFTDREDVPTGRRVGILLACALALSVVAGVDYLVRHELSFSLFYLFPIASAAWFGGRWVGVGFAILAAFLWATSDVLSGHFYPHWAMSYWNVGVRLVYFLGVAMVFDRLQELLSRERLESATDPLTGILNRAGWFERAEIELTRARRFGSPISVAYVDLDDFKRVNDLRGHAEGDQVLSHVARTLRGAVRRSDMVARVGGDEFVVLLLDASPEAARTICDKLHETLTKSMADRGWPVGFSVGVAAFSSPPDTVQDIVSIADSSMYVAKREGKGKVVIAAG